MTILLAPSGPFVVSAASHRGGRLNLRLGHRTGPRDLRKDLTKQLTPARRPHRTLIPFTPSKTNQLLEAARFPANARVKRKLTQNVNAQKSRTVTRSQEQIHEQRRRVPSLAGRMLPHRGRWKAKVRMVSNLCGSTDCGFAIKATVAALQDQSARRERTNVLSVAIIRNCSLAPTVRTERRVAKFA